MTTFVTTHSGAPQDPSTTSQTTLGGSGEPGCSARGRLGLAGLRADAPSYTTAPQPHWCGGRRRGRKARASCKTRGLAAVPVGGGRARAGLETTRQATHQQPSATGVEGAGGIGGPGCGARGRRRGQGGPRDRSLRAAGSRVAISRAGRRPRAHHAARPVNAYKNAHPEPGGRI